MPLASYGAIGQKERWTPMASYGGFRVNITSALLIVYPPELPNLTVTQEHFAFLSYAKEVANVKLTD